MGIAPPTRILENVSWYFDEEARSRKEPGIYHSYMSSLATAIDYIKGGLDPVWLMGSSAFAFRIWANEVMCPSAMSMFNFSAVLPETVEQAGYHCVYISRMWDEGGKEQARKEQAHAAIIDGIDKGAPSIVWDIADAEWGLIIGYNKDSQSYETLTCKDKRSSLAFGKLGQNGINILSVATPTEQNRRDNKEIILNSLTAAVAHAEQKEWTDRPKYQNGLAAYDLWALLFDRWALILEAGKGDNLPSDIPHYATYYAGHHYSARCYARDYLKMIGDGNMMLQKASLCYDKVASSLKPVWDCFSGGENLTHKTLSSLSGSIKDAKAAEEEGINCIKEYIS